MCVCVCVIKPSLSRASFKQREHESVDKYTSIPIPQWDKFKAFSNDTPEWPSWDCALLSQSSNSLINAPYIDISSFLSTSSPSSFVFPGITSQINYLHPKFSSQGLLLLGEHKLRHCLEVLPKFTGALPSSSVHLSVPCPGVAFTGLRAG